MALQVKLEEGGNTKRLGARTDLGVCFGEAGRVPVVGSRCANMSPMRLQGGFVERLGG